VAELPRSCGSAERVRFAQLVKYGAAVLTPVLIEDTWEPKGEPGWGLWKTAEAEVEFELSFRTTSAVERGKLILGIEDAFQSTSPGGEPGCTALARLITALTLATLSSARA